MQASSDDILLLTTRIQSVDLDRLVTQLFGDMVKFVADLDRSVIAIGGQLHADAEAMLLADGSRQDDLWGGNYYPDRDREHCIEYTSMINIRPAQANPGMELADAALRESMRGLVFALIGSGRQE